MAGPWDQYQQTDAKKPWEKFQASPTPSAPASAPLSRTDKFIKGIRDPIDAGAQLLTNMLPSGLVNAGNRLNNVIADATGLVGRLPEGGVDQQVRDAEQAYQARRKDSGESGIDAYRALGNIASPANLAIASRLPMAATLGGRMGIGALGGAASGALTPVGEGNFAEEKAKQAGIGALFGGAIPGVASALGRIIKPNASSNASLKLLRDEGVNPTIGQALGGTANKIEERFQSIPVVGDMISRARRSANSDFEAAAYNRALAPIRQEIPAGLNGRDAVQFTESALKSSYDDVLNRIGAITPDTTFANNVAQLQTTVNKMMIPKVEKQKFNSALNDVKSSIDQNGVITSDIYKILESSLGTDARKLGSSQNIYEGKISKSVQQLQAELRDMLKRQAGQNADDLAAVNSGWANFKRVQNAAAKVGAEEGSFSPAQFQNAVRAMDKSKDKSAFARGSALGQDLGDAGKTILGSKVPNSGTPERMLLAGGTLGGGALLSPGALLGLIGAGAAYTPFAQKALVGAVANRPASAQQAAQLLRQSSPYLLPASGQFGLGVMDQ